MQLNGSQILIESLISQGVDTIFGYPGGAVLNIYDALFQKQDALRHILCSHEQGASHAADGYARATGKVGVTLATSGPGATNLVTGLATAYHDSVPMVAITGNVTLDLQGRDSFQEVDIISITKTVTKKNFFVEDASQIPAIVREAFAIADSGRKGPVLIDIPKDITAAIANYTPLPPYERYENPSPAPDALQKAIHVLQDAKRPLIYCGGGVTFSDAAQVLLDFAEKMDIPICSSMTGIASIPSHHPLHLGLVGMHGTMAANLAVSHCDVLLAVGARFSDRVAGNRQKFAQQANIIHIDIDAREFSKNVACDIALHGDCSAVLTALSSQLSGTSHTEWIAETAEHKANMPLPSAQSIDEINPREVILSVRDIFGPDTIIVTDVGQHQMLTAQYYPFAYPRSFLSSSGLGTMGYGLGAANGAAAGNPEKPVVLITGDGSFHMNLQELAASVSSNLKVVVIVMNNGVLGMVNQWQKLFYGGRYSHTEICRKTDFVKLAEAFGATGFSLAHKNDISSVLESAKNCSGVCVIDCQIPSRERVYPIIPSGMTEKEAILSDNV